MAQHIINDFLKHMRHGIPQNGKMYLINNYICYCIGAFNAITSSGKTKMFSMVLLVNNHCCPMPKFKVIEPSILKPPSNRNLFKKEWEKLKSFSESLTTSNSISENELAMIENAYVYSIYDGLYAILDCTYNILRIGSFFAQLRVTSNGFYYANYMIVSDKEYRKQILEHFLYSTNGRENIIIPNMEEFKKLQKQLSNRMIFTHEDRVIATSLLKYKLKDELGICNYD